MMPKEKPPAPDARRTLQQPCDGQIDKVAARG